MRKCCQVSALASDGVGSDSIALTIRGSTRYECGKES
jgi:hypothetical protein